MSWLSMTPLVWLLFILLVLVILRFFSTYNPRNCRTGATRCTKREVKQPNKYYEYDLQGKNGFDKTQIQSIAQRNMTEMPIVFWKKKECLWVVAEPVGIKKAGRIACRIAVENILESYLEKEDMPAEAFLKKACFRAHRKISENINQGSSGCSIALVYINSGKAYWASCGNIGIYLCNKELVQVNRMDLYQYQLSEAVLRGKMKADTASSHQLKKELTAYLGHENLQKIELCKEGIPLKYYDQILVATKSIYEILPPVTLERILKKHRGIPQEKVKKIMAEFEQKRNEHADPEAPIAVLGSGFR